MGRMTDSDYPWDPPLAGTETEQLTGALDRLRTVFRWKADDLDRNGLQTRAGASTLTLGGLLKHLAAIEDYYVHTSRERTGAGVARQVQDWDENGRFVPEVHGKGFASELVQAAIAAAVIPQAPTRRRG
jgi:hypothetical protein